MRLGRYLGSSARYENEFSTVQSGSQRLIPDLRLEVFRFAKDSDIWARGVRFTQVPCRALFNGHPRGRAVAYFVGGVMAVTYARSLGRVSESRGVQVWSAPPRNIDWVAACITLG
jgi:hypothetical protein